MKSNIPISLSYSLTSSLAKGEKVNNSLNSEALPNFLSNKYSKNEGTLANFFISFN